MGEKRLILTICGLTVVLVAVFAVFLTIFVRAGVFYEIPDTYHHFQNIPQRFNVYAAPDFHAAVHGVYAPQDVEILERFPSGWVRIAYGGGFNSGWVFTAARMYILDRPLGIFHAVGDTEHVGLIGPGEVEVLAEEGNWLLLNTDNGPMWTDLTFWPSIDVLSGFLDNFPIEVSVFFRNLDTGFTFGHNCDMVYTSASLNKAAHALYVYHLAENGLTDLQRTHVFNGANMRLGTGVIRLRHPFGTAFTEKELLRYSVQYSDNTAFHLLVDIYLDHSHSYHQFYREMGGDVSLVGNIRGHMMTAAEAGFLMEQIHRYLESGGTYSEHFRHSLLNSDVPIITSDYPIAQKYGHWHGAFHDMAIVYAPSPYILVIMSALDQLEPHDEFAKISWFFQDFNNRYFGR